MALRKPAVAAAALGLAAAVAFTTAVVAALVSAVAFTTAVVAALVIAAAAVVVAVVIGIVVGVAAAATATVKPRATSTTATATSGEPRGTIPLLPAPCVVKSVESTSASIRGLEVSLTLRIRRLDILALERTAKFTRGRVLAIEPRLGECESHGCRRLSADK